MAPIVGLHGMGQQLTGSATIEAVWRPALQDGMERAGVSVPEQGEFACAFYGDVFRPEGKGVGEIPYRAGDVTDALERELLFSWWREASTVEREVPGPGDNSKLRTPDAVQRALNALMSSRFFAGVLERGLISLLKQMRRYFMERDLRTMILQRVAEKIEQDTRVLVAHSMGTVVAYEALCKNPGWPVTTLLTLGAPLGIRNLVFDRLDPAPVDGIGLWPGTISTWANVTDSGDVIALVKELRPRFGPRVVDLKVHNGAKAHDIRPYLTAVETGRVIAAAVK